MVIQEISLRVGQTEVMGLTLYDGVRVVERRLAAAGPSLLLIGTRSQDPVFEGLIGFLHGVDHGVGAVDAIQAALEEGRTVVDLRQVLRPATPGEIEAMHAASEPSGPPPGAERMSPADAAAFLRSKGAEPPPQAPEPGSIRPPQGGTGLVLPTPPQARPVVARPVPPRG